MLRLETIKGPVDDTLLRHIGEMYGVDTDTRYRSLDFVRAVFNGNPAGYSYHVFAFDGDRAVGCYAIIPFPIVSRGRAVPAGKAEALFLHKDYRTQRVGGALAGIAMMMLGHKFALESGIELLFSLPGADVGLILRATGFKMVQAPLDHRYFLLRPGEIRQLHGSRKRMMAAQGLSLAQRALAAAFNGHGRVEIGRSDYLSRQISRIAAREPVAADKWSVGVSEEALRWWLSFGYLQILTADAKPEEYALFTRGGPGGNVEILDWNLTGAGTAALGHIVRLARQEGTLAVSFAQQLAASPSLRRAAALLGFIPRRIERTIYVYSKDPFYRDPANLQFNWLFTI